MPTSAADSLSAYIEARNGELGSIQRQRELAISIYRNIVMLRELSDAELAIRNLNCGYGTTHLSCYPDAVYQKLCEAEWRARENHQPLADANKRFLAIDNLRRKIETRKMCQAEYEHLSSLTAAQIVQEAL